MSDDVAPDPAEPQRGLAEHILLTPQAGSWPAWLLRHYGVEGLRQCHAVEYLSVLHLELGLLLEQLRLTSE